jgi:hypothetical protein
MPDHVMFRLDGPVGAGQGLQMLSRHRDDALQLRTPVSEFVISEADARDLAAHMAPAAEGPVRTASSWPHRDGRYERLDACRVPLTRAGDALRRLDRPLDRHGPDRRPPRDRGSGMSLRGVHLRADDVLGGRADLDGAELLAAVTTVVGRPPDGDLGPGQGVEPVEQGRAGCRRSPCGPGPGAGQAVGGTQ